MLTTGNISQGYQSGTVTAQGIGGYTAGTYAKLGSECPHCGYCSHCGRSNTVWPNTYPYMYSNVVPTVFGEQTANLNTATGCIN